MRVGRNTTPSFDGVNLKCPGCGGDKLWIKNVFVYSTDTENVLMTTRVHVGSNEVDTKSALAGYNDDDSDTSVSITFDCENCGDGPSARDLVFSQQGRNVGVTWQ